VVVGVRYGVLGPLVVLDGDHLTPLGGSTQRRILAALLPDVGTPVAWETLAARVWDEVPVRHTLPRLHRGLDQLRDRLGDDALRLDDHSVVLTATRDDVDAGAFERQALQARELLDAGAFVEAREQLLAAQQLWRGSPYVEFTGAAFAAVEAARLGQHHADVEDGLVAAGIALGQGTELVELARRTTQRAPADARGWARLAVVLYRAQPLPAAVHACEEGLRACDDPQQLLALRDRLEHHDPVLMAPDPWSGTGGSGIPQRVAILLLDLVGSTRMWATHADHMPGIMAAFHGICDRVVSGYGGRLPPDQGEGDARLGVFPTVDQAVAAAAELTRRLAAQSWPDQLVVHARMSVHVGDVVESGGNVFGQTVNYTARVRGLGHGGQVLLSDAAAAELTRTADTSAQVLGSYPLRDIEGEQQVWQLRAPGLGTDFPPLKVEAAARALVRLDPDAPCPYRGLAAYDVDDAALFAGRERLTAALAARLVDHDLVIVTGPSGAGKSSLVRAGLLAALRQGALPGSDAWQVAVTVPATDPVAAVSVADADLLVLDQAEELFTLSDEDARREAAAQLAAQLERGCRVVLVIRGDFFGRLAELPELAPHVGSATVLVGAPNDDDLRWVV
jgi:class 3 adenylate cyclase/DNA-binding SARP family transcriptional activator